jgi:long-chain acyl-CoA synthetase
MNAIGSPPKPGSVGRALPGLELRLVDREGQPIETAAAPDPEDIDEDVSDPAQDTGLVAVRGPNLFSGYWPDGSGGPDDEGWFRTADVGFLDHDGDLHLVDRSSDLVIVNGFNVYPREVETVLAELPAVAEAAVVGVPDENTGEAVKAVLVPVGGAELTEEEVRAHCTERLARFKVPSVIEFIDALPRTPTGKVARRQLAGRS